MFGYNTTSGSIILLWARRSVTGGPIVRDVRRPSVRPRLCSDNGRPQRHSLRASRGRPRVGTGENQKKKKRGKKGKEMCGERAARAPPPQIDSVTVSLLERRTDGQSLRERARSRETR